MMWDGVENQHIFLRCVIIIHPIFSCVPQIYIFSPKVSNTQLIIFLRPVRNLLDIVLVRNSKPWSVKICKFHHLINHHSSQKLSGPPGTLVVLLLLFVVEETPLHRGLHSHAGCCRLTGNGHMVASAHMIWLYLFPTLTESNHKGRFLPILSHQLCELWQTVVREFEVKEVISN